MKTDYKELSNVTLLFILTSLIATASVVICAFLSYFVGYLLLEY